VVKLGGSLAESMRLSSILEIVARSRVPIVLVPGGGSFADAVRQAQADFKFSDTDAHYMALLAMHQTGMMLAAMNPRLKLAETLPDLRRAISEGRIPVWLPMKLTKRDSQVSADWTTTSDGLAARLAERLGRSPVLLVKSCRIEPGMPVAALVLEGVVDPSFAQIVDRARLSWKVLGTGDEAELMTFLDAGVRSANVRRIFPRDSNRRAAPARAIARRR